MHDIATRHLDTMVLEMQAISERQSVEYSCISSSIAYIPNKIHIGAYLTTVATATDDTEEVILHLHRFHAEMSKIHLYSHCIISLK